ncbi:winged helix-turn-helix domain-containing protein [Plantactinospora sp. KLBMP9567]|uniref:winged helix-turn-helix domain-containing protein n=1 Tax=Plantactinospora sp. KLBMP9567 TaxID=3085900 RepID=UPI0029828DA6|nr:winged helix-turn-helix domain-containing protein [Plantactinospora sp. KLBMP9567]MDW5327474.1 winged helix-turn-helix domain-containing protein [Plantactinospora sp. KLBMP9567]
MQPSSDRAVKRQAVKRQAVERWLDAHSLRGLAHPMRLRILDILRLEGPSNSTRLAEQVSESTGTVSWHLRQLAQHGFIEEDPGHRSKRERWWRARARAGVFDTKDLGEDPAAREEVAELLQEILGWSFHRVARHLRSDLPGEWRNTGNISEWTELRLTAKQMIALTEELTQMVERYLPAPGDEPAPDSRPVVVQFQVFPAAPETGSR